MDCLKVFIAYDTKYGNTKLAAEHILKGISENEGFEVVIDYVKNVEATSLVNFDVIVLGAPNHMAQPSRAMKKFIEYLSKVDLKTKYVAIFGTYSGKERTIDRATKKLVTISKNMLPNLTLLLPSLSLRVKGVKGPIFESELSKSLDFGKAIADKLKSRDEIPV